MAVEVAVEFGDQFSYRTQEGNEYLPSTKCGVIYKPGATCSSIKFSCSEFSLISKRTNCVGGDKMVITNDGKRKTYGYRMYASHQFSYFLDSVKTLDQK